MSLKLQPQSQCRDSMRLSDARHSHLCHKNLSLCHNVIRASITYPFCALLSLCHKDTLKCKKCPLWKKFVLLYLERCIYLQPKSLGRVWTWRYKSLVSTQHVRNVIIGVRRGIMGANTGTSHYWKLLPSPQHYFPQYYQT